MNRNSSKNSIIVKMITAIFVCGFALFQNIVNCFNNNGVKLGMVVFVIMIVIVISIAVYSYISQERRKLLEEILEYLDLADVEYVLSYYDDKIIVKSRQTLNNYDDIKYLKENDCFNKVKSVLRLKKQINKVITLFLEGNEFEQRSQYNYVKNMLLKYISYSDAYRVLVSYISSAGNNLGNNIIEIDDSRIREIDRHPEYLMTKSEYNKLLKQQTKEELENKKHSLYDQVNSIIEFANESKDSLIIKNRTGMLDELIQQLFDRTVNSIQKIKQLDSDEWNMIQKFIANINNQIQKIVKDDNKIKKYYESKEFQEIKETCNSLNLSRKEFNEYIEEKAQSISNLFGTRVIRNETLNEDIYNYVRAYKKSITPFTAEVSSSVFASAENNPIDYIIKFFYPNRNQYKEQIQKLKVLIEELETLKEAKVIIDNYKKDYDKYIQGVPKYVLENDENGFYNRLGLAIIDEAVLNVEYKFVYTSGGGMAQRSFTIPMNEENIIELINRLENKLTLKEQTKEQRALMTVKLRMHIKERDNFTCCQCGNSIKKEPNLLLEVDHIIPIVKGGLTKEDNLQTLCWKCNRSKGAKLV